MATYVPKLPDDVAAEYELVDWKGGHRQSFGKFGVVDLEKITLQQARSLVARGFHKLRVRTKEAPAKEPAESPQKRGSKK